MSTKYKRSEDVPTDALAERLKELADICVSQQAKMCADFSMRVPAELDRDADLVLAESARRLTVLTAALTAAQEEARIFREESANRQILLNIARNSISVKNEENTVMRSEIEKLRGEVERLSAGWNKTITTAKDLIAQLDQMKMEHKAALSSARWEGMMEAVEVLKERAAGWRKNMSALGGSYAKEADAAAIVIRKIAEEVKP